MKKLIVIVLAVFLLLLGAVIAWSTIKFNSFSFSEAAIALDEKSLGYYLDSYERSRDAFRKVSDDIGKKYKNVKRLTLAVPSNISEGLTVDVLYIPQSKGRKRLLVLSSGVHGVEGFVGSAIQRMFIDDFITADLLHSMGVLIIHGMNPYGFKHYRRVTENNIDLNRNCDTDEALYATKNEGYPKVYPLINPKGSVDTSAFGNRFFHIKAISNILKTSMQTLRQAILQGQYEYPQGVYFGGKQPEAQVKLVSKELGPILRQYSIVLNIDLHTGYGERGVLHLFPNPIEDKNIKAKVENVFKGFSIDWGDTGSFYTTTGDFSTFLGKLIPGNTYLPMTFEYGTMNSNTTLGAIKSLHVTILENQGHHFGYASKADEVRVKSNFLEMYYPTSPSWRMKVMEDTKKVMQIALENFKSM